MIDPFQIIINVYLVLMLGILAGVLCFAVASFLNEKLIPACKKYFKLLTTKKEEIKNAIDI